MVVMIAMTDGIEVSGLQPSSWHGPLQKSRLQVILCRRARPVPPAHDPSGIVRGLGWRLLCRRHCGQSIDLLLLQDPEPRVVEEQLVTVSFPPVPEGIERARRLPGRRRPWVPPARTEFESRTSTRFCKLTATRMVMRCRGFGPFHDSTTVYAATMPPARRHSTMPR